MSTIKHKLSLLSNAQNVLEAGLNSVSTAVNTLPTANARIDSIEEAQRKLDTDITSFKDIQDHMLVKVKEIQNVSVRLYMLYLSICGKF
jgi:DNA repair ATPase RecN